MRRRVMMAVALVALASTRAALGSDIVLVSGEKLIGTIREIRNDAIVLEHAHLGTLEIKLSSIRLIDGAPPPAPKAPPVRSDADAPVLPPGRQRVTAEAMQPASAKEGAPPPVVGPAGIPEWSSSLEFGVSLRSGRSDDFSGRVRLEIARTDRIGQMRLDAAYRYATARTDKIENEFTAGAFIERKVKRDLFTLFGQTRFDADEFQPWERRLTGNAGMGLRLLESTEISPAGVPRTLATITQRLGAGFRQEYGDVDETVVPEGLIGLEFDLRVTPAQTFTASSTIFPDLRQTNDYRLVSTAGWTIKIDELDGISLRIGMTHEYESITVGEIDHNDLSAFAALVFTF